VSLARLNEAPGEGEFGEIRGERKRRHLVYTRFSRTDRDAHVLAGVQRHVFKFLLHAFVWVHTVEIERQRVEELKLFRLRLCLDLGLEPVLPDELAIEHPLGQWPVLQRNSVD